MSYEKKFYEINLKCHGKEWDQVQSLAQEADNELAELKSKGISELVEHSSTVLKLYNVRKELEANKKEITTLIKAFKHFHQNNGADDSCRECGLDLRNPVHLRG